MPMRSRGCTACSTVATSCPALARRFGNVDFTHGHRHSHGSGALRTRWSKAVSLERFRSSETSMVTDIHARGNPACKQDVRRGNGYFQSHPSTGRSDPSHAAPPGAARFDPVCPPPELHTAAVARPASALPPAHRLDGRHPKYCLQRAGFPPSTLAANAGQQRAQAAVCAADSATGNEQHRADTTSSLCHPVLARRR